MAASLSTRFIDDLQLAPLQKEIATGDSGIGGWDVRVTADEISFSEKNRNRVVIQWSSDAFMHNGRQIQPK